MFTTLLNGFSFDTKAIKDSLKGSPAGDRSKYDFDLVLEEVVAMLMAIMDNNLGEKTEEVSQVGASLLQKANQWKDIEATLINTKEKYNNLVDQSSNLFQSAKKIGNSFAELIMAINKCL